MTELNGKVTVEFKGAQVPFIEFRGAAIAGNGGVNHFSGRWKLAGDRLTIDPGAMTLMAGPEPLMQQEAEMLEALRQTTTYRIAGDRLELSKNVRTLAAFTVPHEVHPK